SIGVSLVDAEHGEFEVTDVPARSLGAGAPPRDTRMPLAGTLLARVIAEGAPVRVDDLEDPAVPAASRAALAGNGYRSAVLVPLSSRGAAFGAMTLVSRHPRAFTDADVEVAAELARPLAAAVEQRRLVEESRRRAEELAALYHTSRLITARLDAAS